MNCANWVLGRSVNERESEEKLVDGRKGSFLETEMSGASDGIVKIRGLELAIHSEGTGENVSLQPNINTTSWVCDANAAVRSANCADNVTKARNGLDLNTDDMSACGNELLHTSKGSEEMDSWEVWKRSQKYNMHCPSAMSEGIPRARGRSRSGNDSIKKRVLISKKQRADTVSRLAAPSGLLNGLNPGILNHVRNSKQVRAIIENILKSESLDNHLSGSARNNETNNSRQELTRRNELGNTGCPSAESAKDGGAWEGNTEDGDGKSVWRHTSSVAVACENRRCTSNDELVYGRSVSSLSKEAANVAAQWLELLNHDIRGRLLALKQSKKRVMEAIHTELPLQMQSEFSSNLPRYAEADTCHLNRAMADAHFAKWIKIFMQMQKALDEEEQILESWLNQLQQVRLQCEKGLSGDWGLEKTDSVEAELAVRATAASMYSMCNYLLSA